MLNELRVLIISKGEAAANFASAYPFVQDIVGNTICTDLIDYIQRDHLNTGLPLALAIWSATNADGEWDQWEEVHGPHYVFKGYSAGLRAKAHELVDKAWDEVGVED